MKLILNYTRVVIKNIGNYIIFRPKSGTYTKLVRCEHQKHLEIFHNMGPNTKLVICQQEKSTEIFYLSLIFGQLY